MNAPLIQFHALEKDILPAPYPAVQALPEWFKELAGGVVVPGTRGTMHTVKQCPPFLDAMMSGYVLPLCGEVHFELGADGQLSIDCPNGDTSVESHHPAQVAGSPWADLPVIKFINPWIVVTPPGYSTLFVPPMNHEPIPFRVLAGVVDTDAFYAPVNFPAVCQMARGSRCVLTRGTPIVQAIPFKRESWQSQIAHADAAQLERVSREMTHSHHVYREQDHRKKTFG
ncbi:MAG TPA: hypothetical protein VHY37_04155 [Tepidisphaeraceae bacterium]|jgi:hypothetical protein|nr:hypothetical protein [Tepidisphaeraceae bacterium]